MARTRESARIFADIMKCNSEKSECVILTSSGSRYRGIIAHVDDRALSVLTDEQKPLSMVLLSDIVKIER